LDHELLGLQRAPGLAQTGFIYHARLIAVAESY
jgi:hypothetical protein